MRRRESPLTEESRKILEMVANRKLSPEDADRLAETSKLSDVLQAALAVLRVLQQILGG